MATSNVDEDLQDFDPMADAYGDSVFNNYSGGYGQPEATGPKAAVYVQQIPLDMEQGGLRCLFNKAGSVLNVQNFYQPKNCAYKVGKVVFGSLQEAANAISLFNQKEPYYLKVRLFRESPSSGNQQYGNTSDNGLPHTGHSREAMSGRRTIDARNNFRHGTSNNENRDSQRLPLRQPRATVDQDKSVLGETRNATMSAANHNVNHRNANSAAAKNSVTDSQGAESRPPVIPDSSGVATSQVRKCLNCGKAPIYMCTRCKGPYCSPDCQLQDWARHKQYCKPQPTKGDGSSGDRQAIEVRVPTTKNTAAQNVDDVSKSPRNVDHSKEAERATGNHERQYNSSSAPSGQQQQQRQRSDHQTQQQQQQQPEDQHHNRPVRSERFSPRGQSKTPTAAARKFQQGTDRHEHVRSEVNENRQQDRISNSMFEDFAAKFFVSQPSESSKRDFNGGKPNAERSPPTDDANGRHCVEWPSPGSKELVFVRSLTNPSDFWVARTNYIKTLELITKEIQIESNACSPLKAFSVGDMVAAKFSEDHLYYRAVIDRINKSGSLFVTYVDYGNSETVEMQNLRPLSASLSIRPRAAYHCSLANAKPYRDESAWSPSSIAAFRMFMKTCVSATCVDDSGEKMSVLIADQQGIDVGDMLCETQRASPKSYINRAINPDVTPQAHSPSRPPQPPHPAEVSMYVSHLAKWKVNDTVELQFACTVGDTALWMTVVSIGDLQLLRNLNNNCSLDAKSYCATEGMVVSAYSRESKAWYRAIVRSLASKGACTVQYLDYGNVETVDHVLKLPDEFSWPPALAVQLIFQDDATCRSVQEIACSRDLSVTVLETSRAEEVKVRVALPMAIEEVTLRSVWHRQFSPLTALASLKKVHQAASTFSVVCEAPIPIGEVTVRPLYVDSKDSVYVMTGTYETLHRMQAELLVECEKPQLKTLSSLSLTGHTVCAKFSADNRWYRGRVESCNPARGTVSVRYLDFGNVEDVPLDGLKPLLPQFSTIPQMALNVRPQGTAAFSKDDLESILMGDQTPDWHMTVLDATERPIYVRFSKGGRTLQDFLNAKLGGAVSPKPKPMLPAVVELEVGTTIKLCFIDVLKGGIITCFRSDEKVVMEMDRLCTDITELCEREPPPPKDSNFKPVLADLVLAKLKNDGNWYRCNVIKILGNDQFEVMYSDYGNFAVVSIDDMRPFVPAFSSLPLQSVTVMVEGVICDRLSTLDNMRELFLNKNLSVEIVDRTPDGIYVIRVPQLENEMKERRLK